jgi:hypothetical protein
LSEEKWVLAIQLPGINRHSRHVLEARGEELASFVERLKATCAAAGRRIARVIVIQPSSLPVDRRARRAKTDIIDVEMLLRTLMAWLRVEPRVCSMVFSFRVTPYLGAERVRARAGARAANRSRRSDLAVICAGEGDAQMAEPQESVAGDTTALPESMIFTLDTATGGVLKLEIVDATHILREITKAERLELAQKFHGGVDALLERAFEAGVAALLDGEGEKEERDETDDEAGVRRVLLEPLLEETFAARDVRRASIRKAIIRSLIEDVAAAGAPEAERATSKAAS